MSRKERNDQFVDGLDNVSNVHLLVAAKMRYEFKDMAVDDIKKYIKDKYVKEPDSWVIADVATEYNKIKHLNGDNLQIWSNYRKYGNYNEPIAKANGDFLAVAFKGVNVTIDGQEFTITNSEHITVPANHYSGDGCEYATISFAAITKLLQIRGHLEKIAKFVN